jgi:hypothetical protein
MMQRLLTKWYVFPLWVAVWFTVTMVVMVSLSAHDGPMFWWLGCSIAFLLLTGAGWLLLYRHRQDSEKQRVS